MPSLFWRYEDRIASFFVYLAVLVIVTTFLFLLGHILMRGAIGLDFSFLFSAPENAGRDGGISTILVSTLLILLVCMLVSLPIGVGTSLLLSEFTAKDNLFGHLVRRSLDILAGIPSIVFGLFGNVFFCKILGMGFSILAGGLTLACMVLPILIRTFEEGLRLVPVEYRMAGEALAVSRTTILLKYILPAATPALIAGFILGIGRAIAETAALIFTSGYVDRMPESIMDSGRALSIHIYDLSMNVSGGDASAYKSAVVLILLILIINGLAMGIMRSWARKKVMLS